MKKKHSKTPLEFYKALKYGNIEQVQQIIQEGVDLEMRVAQSGCTPLEIAVAYGHLEIVQALLKAGVSIKEGEQYSLLENAIREGKTDILILLIEAAIDVNQDLNHEQEKALMRVALRGDIKAVLALFKAKVNVNAVSKNGDFALLNAAMGGHQQVFNYLAPLTWPELRKEAEEVFPSGLIFRQRLNDHFTEKFIYYAARGDDSAVTNAMKKGVNINAFGADGNTALYIASYWGRRAVVSILVEAGADTEIGQESDGTTPLMAAAGNLALAKSNFGSSEMEKNLLEIIALLLEVGANVNAKTTEGWNALIAAANSGSRKAVELLLEAGAEVNVSDNRGGTAISRAKKAGNAEIVQLLRDAGATED